MLSVIITSNERILTDGKLYGVELTFPEVCSNLDISTKNRDKSMMSEKTIE
jgi:hypothetical protein